MTYPIVNGGTTYDEMRFENSFKQGEKPVKLNSLEQLWVEQQRRK